MKWVETEEQARTARDLSIECTARLDATVAWVEAAADPAYFTTYRRLCAMVMWEFVEIINRAAFDVPALKPSEAEWKRVAEERFPSSEGALTRPIRVDDLRAAMATVKARLRELEALRCRVIGSDMPRYVRELDAAINGWLS